MIVGKRIAVIGAGVAGLAVARALAMRGARVQVLEQAEQIREFGAGLQISPNGFAVIKALGLADDILRVGLASQAMELRTHRGGQVLRMELARAGWSNPFVLIHRGNLIEVLAGGLADLGVTLTLGHKAQAAEIDADLVIGADGVHSALRTELNGKAEPQFSGQCAWRCIVPDDGRADGPAESHVYMGPGQHLVTYPLGDGRRNIVAVQERAEWAADGWSHRDHPAHLQTAFAGFAPQVRSWLGLARDVHLWGLFLYPVAPVWHDRARVLIGDAAHPTLPFMAQGANLALEDAWVLAECLNQFDQAEALQRFQATRRPRAVRAVAAAKGNARKFHLRNPAVRFAAHNILRIGSRVAPMAPLKRFDRLYGYDPTAGVE